MANLLNMIKDTRHIQHDSWQKKYDNSVTTVVGSIFAPSYCTSVPTGSKWRIRRAKTLQSGTSPCDDQAILSMPWITETHLNQALISCMELLGFKNQTFIIECHKGSCFEGSGIRYLVSIWFFTGFRLSKLGANIKIEFVEEMIEFQSMTWPIFLMISIDTLQAWSKTWWEHWISHTLGSGSSWNQHSLELYANQASYPDWPGRWESKLKANALLLPSKRTNQTSQESKMNMSSSHLQAPLLQMKSHQWQITAWLPSSLKGQWVLPSP